MVKRVYGITNIEEKEIEFFLVAADDKSAIRIVGINAKEPRSVLNYDRNAFIVEELCVMNSKDGVLSTERRTVSNLSDIIRSKEDEISNNKPNTGKK